MILLVSVVGGWTHAHGSRTLQTPSQSHTGAVQDGFLAAATQATVHSYRATEEKKSFLFSSRLNKHDKQHSPAQEDYGWLLSAQFWFPVLSPHSPTHRR